MAVILKEIQILHDISDSLETVCNILHDIGIAIQDEYPGFSGIIGDCNDTISIQRETIIGLIENK